MEQRVLTPFPEDCDDVVDQRHVSTAQAFLHPTSNYSVIPSIACGVTDKMNRLVWVYLLFIIGKRISMPS
jgi:hypothetical protein